MAHQPRFGVPSRNGQKGATSPSRGCSSALPGSLDLRSIRPKSTLGGCNANVRGKEATNGLRRTLTATTPKTRHRDAAGRFVKRGRRSNRPTDGPTNRPTDGPAEVRHARAVGVRQLAILTLAIVLGVAGFAFSVFWIGSLVVMGMLWGTMAVDRQRPTDGGKGVLAEVVEVVVDEAKNVADSAGSSRRGERQQ
jgi:hypothetical protein